jgi:hypothetical protein
VPGLKRDGLEDAVEAAHGMPRPVVRGRPAREVELHTNEDAVPRAVNRRRR